MPFVFDLNNAISEIYTVQVSPKGWRSPLTIEYGIAQANKYDTTLSVVWRVKGTEHCFSIGEQRLNVISHGHYKEHFEKALEGFREDYLSWFQSEEYDGCQWRDEYKKQFDRLIIGEQDKDNRDKTN